MVCSDAEGAVTECVSELERPRVNQWIELDFCNSDQCERNLDDNSFDVVLDKSTLDCALCSKDATSALLAQSYRALRPNGGVFFLISFHSPQLIVPLLKYLYDNDIEYYTVDRMIDDYRYNEGVELENDQPRTARSTNKLSQSTPLMFCSSHCRESYRQSGRQQSSRYITINHKMKETKHYDKVSAKTVNVFVCRKSIDYNNIQGMNCIDIEALHAHVLQVCNDWFMIENPLVTQVRENTLRHSFREKLGLLHADDIDHDLDGLYLPLEVCYDILFTADEKSNLPYDFFLEDWNAFVLDSSNTDELPEEGRLFLKNENQTAMKPDAMTLQVALTFLKAMQ
jgi:ubiquinone/menaquinone biosynthesis C-methylase UbiE